ncbi:MAG: phasin family protein, partial [Rhodospirillales bacterium]|nr:phasin family protein [Rhodospirillales bacterium]
NAAPVNNNQFEEVFKMSFDMFKGYEDAVVFGKENVEAMVQSSTVVAKGMQNIGSAWADFMKASFDANVAAAKKAASCKDMNEIVAIQADVAKAGYDALVKESGKLSGETVKLAEEAWAPLGSRVNATMEKFGKPFAA